MEPYPLVLQCLLPSLKLWLWGRPGRIPGRLLASWPLPCPWPLRPVPFQSKTGCIQDERLSQLVI